MAPNGPKKSKIQKSVSNEIFVNLWPTHSQKLGLAISKKVDPRKVEKLEKNEFVAKST